MEPLSNVESKKEEKNENIALGKKTRKVRKFKRPIKKLKKVEEPSVIDYRGAFLDPPDFFQNIDSDKYTNKEELAKKISSIVMGARAGETIPTLGEKEFMRRGQNLFRRFKAQFLAIEKFEDIMGVLSVGTPVEQKNGIESLLMKIFNEFDSENSTEYVKEYNNKNFYKANQIIVSSEELKNMSKEENVSVEYKFVNELAYTKDLEKAKILISNDDVLLTEDEDVMYNRKLFNEENMKKINYERYRTSVKAYMVNDYIFEHYVQNKIEGDEKIGVDIETSFPTVPLLKKTGATNNVMCVGYLEPDIYTMNSGVHIPFAGNFKENSNIWATIFKKHIEESYNLKVKFVVVGHEHGTLNKKCHLQISMLLEEKTKRTFAPGFIYIRNRYNEKIGFKILFMFTKCTNSKMNAVYYAKKEKDFQQVGYINSGFELCYEVAYITKGGKEYMTKKVDINKTLYLNKDKNFNGDQVISYLVEAGVNVVNMNVNNIKETYNSIKKGINSVEAVHLPLEGYLLDEEIGPKYVNEEGEMEYHIGKVINKWYLENVKEFQVVNNDYRRKALLICGDRGIGKTFLINQFVSDPRYIKRVCGGIPERFTYNGEKLIVLDDMSFSFYYTKVEMLKSLLSAQECTIDSKYNACVWPAGIPAVILTNDIRILRYMAMSESFRKCVETVYCGSVYLGPPSTKENAYNKVNAEHHLPYKMQKKFDKEWLEIIEKKREKKDKFFDMKEFDDTEEKQDLRKNLKKPLHVDLKKDNNALIGENGEVKINNDFKEYNKDKIKM